MDMKNYKKNLLLFYTGKTHKAGDILQEQKKNTTEDARKIENLHKMVQLAKDLRTELLHDRVDAMGEILKTNWDLKKSLASGVSNPFIDECYERAIKAGAAGGKLLGAGGGGFLLFYVDESNQEKVRETLSDLKEMPFMFDYKGTNVIYYNKAKMLENNDDRF